MIDNAAKSAEEMRRVAIARQVCSLIMTGSLDEVRVMQWIASRVLGGGAEQYGRLSLARDGRDFRNEAADELADAIFYFACDYLKREDARRELLRAEAAAEMTRMPIERATGIAIQFIPIESFDEAPTEIKPNEVRELDAELRDAFARMRVER